MAKELNLIEKHKEIEKEIEDLSLELKYAKDQNQGILIEERIKVLLNEKAKIEKKLNESEDKSTTQAMLENLRQELEEIIEHLKQNRGGHPISRNQGLGIDNFIFGKIIWDISGAFNANGIPVPNYYFEIDGDFDHLPIKNFLSKKLKELQKVKLNELNYLKLKDWVSNLKDQIRAFWEEENTKIKSTVKY